MYCGELRAWKNKKRKIHWAAEFERKKYGQCWLIHLEPGGLSFMNPEFYYTVIALFLIVELITARLSFHLLQSNCQFCYWIT